MGPMRKQSDDHQTIKTEVARLLRTGKKEEAIGLLQTKYNVSAENAEKLLQLAGDESVSADELLRQALKRTFRSRTEWNNMLAFGLGFLGIPSLIMGIALYFYVDYDLKHSELVQGKVVELTPSTEYDPIEYNMYFEYTRHNQIYRKRAPGTFSKGQYQVGDLLTLRMKQEYDESAVIDEPAGHYMGPIIIGAFGLVLTIGMLYFNRQAKQRQNLMAHERRS